MNHREKASSSAPDEFDEEESISKWESLRLKALAEHSYSSDDDLKAALKYTKRAHRLCPTLDGVSEMLTAFKILTAARNNNNNNNGEDATTTTPDWYNILDLQPFSHINFIKKQYKKLALILHPDKNTFVAAEEAFKFVNEAFRVLSDKIKRKEYDMKLRIDMQTAVVEARVESGGSGVILDTFWTACSTCRLLHQFERKYLGHNLMCPNCKKSFEAVEVDGGKKVSTDMVDDDDDRVRIRRDSKRKMSSVGEIMKRSEQSNKIESSKTENVDKHSRVVNRREDKGSRARKSESLKEKTKITNAHNDDDDEMMTLAEMRKCVKTNVNESKLKVKLKVNEKDKVQKAGSTGSNIENKTTEEENRHDLDIMTVEDSDFYDFDEGRVEKSFKKGQIWALYDDDDGMPRHYGLIDEVVSTHPFEVNMSWLDPQSNGDDMLLSLETTGFHISCGRFKVSKKTLVRSLNVFSHIVDCERAAREVYRIHPKKGSVWALYNKNGERGNQLVRNKKSYDIVVFLTSYSEVHGLSMGYLEKVNGYKTIFMRREIGCHAIKWLEKHEVELFSHQIPARKLSGEEVPDLSGDCWELDPASLPSQILTTGRKK